MIPVKNIVKLAEIFKRTEKIGDCLVWTGSFQFSGRNRNVPYPNITYTKDGVRKTFRGHRLVYSLYHGDIAEKMSVMHTCDNTKCMNPDHLRLGTHSENMQDKVAKKRDHNLKKDFCVKGHPYSGDNLYINPSGSRKCRTCMRAYANRYDADNREKRRVAALARYYASKGGTNGAKSVDRI